MRILVEILGIIGTILTLIAYFGLERNKLKSSGIIYPTFNLIAGFLLGFVGVYNKSFSIILINVFWVLISISLLYRNLKRR